MLLGHLVPMGTSGDAKRGGGVGTGVEPGDGRLLILGRLFDGGRLKPGVYSVHALSSVAEIFSCDLFSVTN